MRRGHGPLSKTCTGTFAESSVFVPCPQLEILDFGQKLITSAHVKKSLTDSLKNSLQWEVARITVEIFVPQLYFFGVDSGSCCPL